MDIVKARFTSHLNNYKFLCNCDHLWLDVHYCVTRKAYHVTLYWHVQNAILFNVMGDSNKEILDEIYECIVALWNHLSDCNISVICCNFHI